MNIVGIGMLALISAVTALTLKNTVPQYALLITAAAGIMILTAVCVQLPTVTEHIQKLTELSNINSSHAEVLLKSVGICYISQFASDICKDAGENGLSGKVELAGKIMILICALPLIDEILHTVQGLCP